MMDSWRWEETSDFILKEGINGENLWIKQDYLTNIMKIILEHRVIYAKLLVIYLLN